MPKATVRADAPTLPEATTRRGALGAIIAAGAAGGRRFCPPPQPERLPHRSLMRMRHFSPSSLKRELSTCFRTRATMLRLPPGTE
jgi:hypothetical protein